MIADSRGTGLFLVAAVVLGACGPGDEDCPPVRQQSIADGAYTSDGDHAFDCADFPYEDEAKTMVVDRDAGEVRISYTRATGEQVVEVWLMGPSSYHSY